MVHRMRNQVDGVLVGSGTAIADDPQLTCRIRGGRNPRRILLDGRLRIRPSARLFHPRDPERTIVVTGTRAPAAKARALEARGVQVWRLPLRGGEISWVVLLRKLADAGMVSVMIEGGATVAASALRAKIVDKVIFFYAPKILGGDGRVMFDSLGIRRVDRSLRIRRLSFRKSGTDLMVSGYL
jgi:diaminohydroxyphosphoribosylaminopyrimidine deaminase/5-amino-6-(5-phosphoribosylamino)uracil reductase